MQTTIRIRLSELNSSFLEKLRTSLKQLSIQKDPEIQIVLQESEYDPAFVNLILNSAEEMDANKKQVFTMDSFKEYLKS